MRKRMQRRATAASRGPSSARTASSSSSSSISSFARRSLLSLAGAEVLLFARASDTGTVVCPICEFEGQSVNPGLELVLEDGSSISCGDLESAGLAGVLTPDLCASLQTPATRESCGCGYPPCSLCGEGEAVDPDALFEGPDGEAVACWDAQASARAGLYSPDECLYIQDESVRQACQCQVTAPPTGTPTVALSDQPSTVPSLSPVPSFSPAPSAAPSSSRPPSMFPSRVPTISPTNTVTQPPTHAPTESPTASPEPTASPAPTTAPTASPTNSPTMEATTYTCRICRLGELLTNPDADVPGESGTTCGDLDEDLRDGTFTPGECAPYQTEDIRTVCGCYFPTAPPTPAQTADLDVTACTGSSCTRYATIDRMQSDVDRIEGGAGRICLCSGAAPSSRSYSVANGKCSGTDADTIVISSGKSVTLECYDTGDGEGCTILCPRTAFRVEGGGRLEILGGRSDPDDEFRGLVLGATSTDGAVGSRIHVDSGGTLIVRQTLFEFASDFVPSGDDGDGGGIQSDGGIVVAVNTRFQYLVAPNNGGAIYLNGGALTISDSEFTDNEATDGRGGAIYVAAPSSGVQSALILQGSRFEDNSDAVSPNDVYVDPEITTLVVAGCNNGRVLGTTDTSLGNGQEVDTMLENLNTEDCSEVSLDASLATVTAAPPGPAVVFASSLLVIAATLMLA